MQNRFLIMKAVGDLATWKVISTAEHREEARDFLMQELAEQLTTKYRLQEAQYMVVQTINNMHTPAFGLDEMIMERTNGREAAPEHRASTIKQLDRALNSA